MEFEQLDIFSCGVYEEQDEQQDLDEINLTTRQWKTYNLIKRNSNFGRSTSIREIVDNYPYPVYEDGYVWNDNPRVHNPCASVWQDVNKINAEYNIHKIIIWNDDYQYKLAEDETAVKEFCDELYWKKAMSKLWRYGNLMRKVQRDGQYKLFFKDKTKAREYWQTFLESRVDDLVELSTEDTSEEEK